MTKKFSEFSPAGALVATDEIAGLRGNTNSIFNVAGLFVKGNLPVTRLSNFTVGTQLSPNNMYVGVLDTPSAAIGIMPINPIEGDVLVLESIGSQGLTINKATAAEIIIGSTPVLTEFSLPMRSTIVLRCFESTSGGRWIAESITNSVLVENIAEANSIGNIQLNKDKNLSDVADPGQSLLNIGGLNISNNLSDVSSVDESRQNLNAQPESLFGDGPPNGVEAGILNQMYWDQQSSYLWSCFTPGPAGVAEWRQTTSNAESLKVIGSTVNIGLSSSPSVGQVLTATSPTTAVWQDQVGLGGLLSVNNLSDVESLETSRINLSVPKVSNGVGSPNGVVEGVVNDEFFDDSTTPATFWRCITSGAPGIWEIPKTNALNIPTPNFGEMNFQGNSTPTTFTAINTPVKIVGPYNSGFLQNFTHSAGRLTCTAAGSNVYDVKVATTGSLSFAYDSITIFIALNGSVVAQSAQSVNLDGISPSFKSISLQKLLTLGFGDYVEVWVQNNTSTSSITHQDISLIVGSPGSVGGPSIPVPLFTGFRQTAPVVISNASLGVLNGVGAGSFSIPANSLSAGDTLFLQLSGRTTRAINSSSIRIALAAGAYFLFDTGNVSATSSGNFTLQAFMTVRAVGGPGVASIQTVVQTFNLGSAAPTESFLLTNSTNFSTLTNINLSLNVYWASGALAANSCSAEILTLTKL
jgi:hypothetical protein